MTGGRLKRLEKFLKKILAVSNRFDEVVEVPSNS